VKRALALLLLLAGCSGATQEPPPAQVDETLTRETRAGQLAFSLEHPEEAVAKYRAALTRAQARDDLQAIGDLGYNLAVAELRANAPERALAVARSTRAELERRGAEVFPALLLTEATALYRTGAPAEADAIAAQAESGGDAEAAGRATFLRGLIADEAGNEAGLGAAADRLRTANLPALQADSAELNARLALRRGDIGRAREEAERAMVLRRDTLDYRGLARALALSAEATKQAGDSEAAADLFLRAGRSAAAQGDPQAATPWLREAMALAPGEEVARAAREVLDRIEATGG
jgi:hypothetical protein